MKNSANLWNRTCYLIMGKSRIGNELAIQLCPNPTFSVCFCLLPFCPDVQLICCCTFCYDCSYFILLWYIIFYKKMAGNLKKATIFFIFPATTYSYKWGIHKIIRKLINHKSQLFHIFANVLTVIQQLWEQRPLPFC